MSEPPLACEDLTSFTSVTLMPLATFSAANTHGYREQHNDAAEVSRPRKLYHDGLSTIDGCSTHRQTHLSAATAASAWRGQVVVEESFVTSVTTLPSLTGNEAPGSSFMCT